MGCWNKTCGLSNLHITAGQEVYVFVLEKASDPNDRCYSTSFWHPVVTPFTAEYNDYGGGENGSPYMEYVLDGIKKQLVEMPLGDNKSHDIPVTANLLDEQYFYDAVHEGQLFVNSYRKEPTQVDFVMFRKDIVDHILKNHLNKGYIGQGKGTCGWGNNYVEYKFSDLVAEVPTIISELKDLIDSSADSYEFYILYDHKDTDTPQLKFTRSYINYVKANYRYSKLVRFDDILENLISKDKIDEAVEFLTSVLMMSYIDSFMESTRKLWMPGGHEGSQGAEISSYRTLTSAINTMLDKEEKEYDEVDK